MGRGSSGISGGRATTNAGGGQTPGAVEGDVVTLKVRGNDGESSTINISIQDMSQYEGQDVRLGQGRYSNAPVARVLAADAINNATDANRATLFDFPEGTEGKFTRTDKVPIVRTDRNRNVILDTTTGYVTKIDGQTVYLQKTTGGFAWNIAGVGAGGKVQSFKSAKEDSWAANIISRNKNNSVLDQLNGQLKVLNKNHGKIDARVNREFSNSDYARVARR